MAARTIPRYAQVAVVAYTGPANGDATKKPSRDSYYQSDNYLRHTLAQKLMEEIDQAQASTMYFFDKLPAGLTGWENQRPVKDGARNSGSIDRFVYGHRNGPFETLDRAYDHIKFLLFHGTPSPTNPCPCHRCDTKRTKAETGVVRTRTPVPCPQVQVTSVQAIPDDLRGLKLVDLISALSSANHQVQVAQQPQQFPPPPQAQLTPQPQHIRIRQHQYMQQLRQLAQLPRNPQTQSIQQAQQLFQTLHAQRVQQAPYRLQPPHTPNPTPFQHVSYHQNISSFTYQMQQPSTPWTPTMVDPQLAPSPHVQNHGGKRQAPQNLAAFPDDRGVASRLPPPRWNPIAREHVAEPPGGGVLPSDPRSRPWMGTKRGLEEQRGEDDGETASRKRGKPDTAEESATAAGKEHSPLFRDARMRGRESHEGFVVEARGEERLEAFVEDFESSYGAGEMGKVASWDGFGW